VPPGSAAPASSTILVVGAGTRPTDDPEAPMGNGRAIAVAAARTGATVMCADVDEAAATATAELVAGEGNRAEVLVGDVADEAACAAMVEQAAASGPLTGLVANVGIGRGAGLAGTSAADWDLVAAVNLRSHFLLAKAALPLMPEGAGIVFVSSLAGIRPGSGLPAYDTTKAGLIGLCRHVALEGARRQVRANVVAPGLIDTPLGRAATAGRPSRGHARIPLGRQGTAREVASATLFLLSDAASYITGQVLVVDGGLSLV
jgi:NAD(P)-dependent dehydrogenase (short-subunit alcohol dehydrogenase family)